MKRWLCQALVGLGVCLLLAAGHAEAGRGVDDHPRLPCWRWSVGAWGEPALASPTAALAKNRGPRQARAAAPESLAVELVLLTECGVGPPWLDSRGPPDGAAGTRSTAALPARPVAQGKGVCIFPRSWTKHHAQEGGFATAFS